jgi:hypothetical protein
MFLFVHYCSDMFRPYLLAIFRELACFSTCAAYAPTRVEEILHRVVPPFSAGNTFQDLPRLRETADNTERYI